MKAWDDAPFFKVKVTNHVQVAEGAYVLSFPRMFDFLAGQVIGLGVDTMLPPRLYSIASGEQDPVIEVLYTEKPDGELTPRMSGLKPGDQILVTSPFGRFTRPTAGGVMVAAGTGIAPFASMIRSGKGLGATLIHGASYATGFYFADEMRKQLRDNYIQCCSRCLEFEGFQGRVTRFLENGSGVDTAKKYYLCGSAEMVVDSRDVLIACGVPFGNIEAEIFF